LNVVFCVTRCPAPAPAGRNGQRQLAAVFKSGIFFSAFLSIALTASPQNQPARSWFPLKPTPTGEGWGFRFFMKGDGQKTHSRAEKKRL
jgi:hypothetical protein